MKTVFGLEFILRIGVLCVLAWRLFDSYNKNTFANRTLLCRWLLKTARDEVKCPNLSFKRIDRIRPKSQQQLQNFDLHLKLKINLRPPKDLIKIYSTIWSWPTGLSRAILPIQEWDLSLLYSGNGIVRPFTTCSSLLFLCKNPSILFLLYIEGSTSQSLIVIGWCIRCCMMAV